MRILAVLAAVMVVLLVNPTSLWAGTEVTKFEEPEVRRAFCGKEIPYGFCMCAFENQRCEVMNMTQEKAVNFVQDKFKAWVAKQIAEVAKSCIDGGGHWNAETRQCITCTDGDVRSGNKCVPPNQAGDDVEKAACVSLKEFSDDWVSFTDLDPKKNQAELNDTAKQYYIKRDELATALTKRQQARYDLSLYTIVRSDVSAYRQAVFNGVAEEVLPTLVTLTEKDLQLPSDYADSFATLFDTDISYVSELSSTTAAVVPDDFVFATFVANPITTQLPEQSLTANFETITSYADGQDQATKALMTLTTLPVATAPELSSEVVSELREAHLSSLRLDKVDAVTAAYIALARFSQMQQYATAASIYKDMQSLKQEEFERAKEAVTNSCEQ